MTNYTNAGLVGAELRLTTQFTNDTTPSIGDVNRWITEASDLVDGVTNKKWGKETYTEYFDYDGQERLITKNAPIVTITKLEYNDVSLGSTPVWVEKAEGDYFDVYKETGEILLFLNKFSPKHKERCIRVTYEAGFENVPYKVRMLTTKLVAQRILNTKIAGNVESDNDGGSISVGSISIVEPASYGVNSYKRLQEDIDVLWNQVKGEFGVYRYSI